MNLTRLAVSTALAATTALLAGCEPAADSDADLPRWTLSESAVELGAGADELFHEVGYGLLLPDGRALVADPGNRMVRIYGADGARQEEIGQPGSGPGEFEAIGGVWLDPSGRIGVWDGSLLRATFFEPDGTLEGTRRIPADGRGPAGNLETFYGAFGDGDLLLASLRFGSRAPSTGPVPDRVSLARFTAEGALASELGEVDGLWRAAGSPVPFTPWAYVALWRDSAWAADPWEPRLRMLGPDGAEVRTAELEALEPYDGDPGEALAALEGELEARGRDDRLFFLRQAPPPERIPAIAGLAVDRERDELWVKRYDPGMDALPLRGNAGRVAPGGRWLVIDAEGVPVAWVDLPDSHRILDVRGREVLVSVRDELDVERVARYRIEEVGR